MAGWKNLVSIIERRILLIRGQRVMVDSDLAELYGVTTKRLNEQVRRNKERFPEDFMFLLTQEEKEQVVAICDHLKKLKFSPHLPYVFTEYGALQLASVLNAPRAVQMSIYIVRAFIKLRELLATHKELAQKLGDLERTVQSHGSHIQSLYDAIHQLRQQPPDGPKRRIGFEVKEKRTVYAAGRN